MSQPPPMRMREKLILKLVSRVLVPLIILFALYVQFHGDYGPGGGFQAGVIFAAGLILHGIIFGLDSMQEVVPPIVVERGVALGVLLYAGVGVLALLLGGDFLDYSTIDPEHPSHGEHLGLLGIELGVGITVTCAMTMIFYSFAGRGRK